jgi:hypothetical protein
VKKLLLHEIHQVETLEVSKWRAAAKGFEDAKRARAVVSSNQNTPHAKSWEHHERFSGAKLAAFGNASSVASGRLRTSRDTVS